jgi:hypothetical protein
MNKAWIVVTSEMYSPVAGVMLDSLMPLTKFPIIVYGAGYTPIYHGVECRTFPASNNIGFLRLQAILDAKLDVAVYIDSDMLVGKPIDHLFDEPTAAFPLMPTHPFYDYDHLDYAARHRITRCLRELEVPIKPTLPLVQSSLHVIHPEAWPFLQEVIDLGLRIEKSGFRMTEESAINALLWYHKANRHLGRIVYPWLSFWEDVSQSRIRPLWHGERDWQEASRRLQAIRKLQQERP